MRKLNRAEVMAWLRSDEANEQLTSDDCIEIFLMILKGQSDITKELLLELGADYDVDVEALFKRSVK